MQTNTLEKEKIDNLLSKLPKKYLKEIEDFVSYIALKARKKKLFEERILKAEREKKIRFNSVDDAIKAIVNEAKKD